MLHETRLSGVNPTLQGIVRAACEDLPFDVYVVEGVRTQTRQNELFAQGRTKPGPIVTKTKDSKHVRGLAVDLAPYCNGKIDWMDLDAFLCINKAMFAEANKAKVAIRWGADWDRDGRIREPGESDNPHYELY